MWYVCVCVCVQKKSLGLQRGSRAAFVGLNVIPMCFHYSSICIINGSKTKSKSKKTLFKVGQCKQYNIGFHFK